MQIFIDQRIANEVELLKKRKDRMNKQDQRDLQNDDDDDDFDGNIQYTDIEHLKEFKQVRVGFEGKYLSDWRGALYYFIIKYENYPCKPVKIEFPKEFRHQYIIQNTGVYCHPDWSDKYWKKSTSLEQIINRVVQTFHEIPTYSDYPVDLSIVQLSQNKEEYSKVIKANKAHATIYNNKINDERQYHEQKRQKREKEELERQKKQDEQKIQKLNKQKEREEQDRRLQDQADQINKQKQDYEQQYMMSRQLQPQFYQNQSNQYKQTDLIFNDQYPITSPQVMNPQYIQQNSQQQPQQFQQFQNQNNFNYQQQNYNQQISNPIFQNNQQIYNQQNQNSQQFHNAQQIQNYQQTNPTYQQQPMQQQGFNHTQPHSQQPQNPKIRLLQPPQQQQ